MNILFAADGSKYTKKALAYLVNEQALLGDDGTLTVINVQLPIPPEVKRRVGAQTVRDYHHDEAEAVLAPIAKFLERHGLAFKSSTAVGHPAEEIVKAAKKAKAQMIVMGTHGYGPLGLAVMGSVAQKVLAQADCPVLLVK